MKLQAGCGKAGSKAIVRTKKKGRRTNGDPLSNAKEDRES
jgi:hypothetical protein